jgi:tetratricopeptide (TPR) repeat protein
MLLFSGCAACSWRGPAEFQKELQLDSSNANAAYELGEIHRTSGQLNEAKSAFELALKSHPDFEEAHLRPLAGTILFFFRCPRAGGGREFLPTARREYDSAGGNPGIRVTSTAIDRFPPDLGIKPDM